MKQEVILTAPKTKVKADCYGCDHCEYKEAVIKKGLFGLGKKIGYSFHCNALNIQIKSDLINLLDMKKEECPCKFEKWQQTNSDLGDFIELPTYTFKVKDNKILIQ